MKNTLIVIFLFVWGVSYSQNPYPKSKYAKIVLENILVVELKKETSDTEKYKNKAIKEVFEQEWTLTEVLFLSTAEIKKLKKQKKSGYTFLVNNDAISKDRRSGYIDSNGRRHQVGMGGAGSRSYQYTAFAFAYYSFELQILKGKKYVNVTEIGFANGELTKIDFLYLCQQLSRLVESSSKGIPSKDYYNVKKNIEDIKGAKLILLSDFFKEKDKEKIPTYYKYNFELVDQKKHEDIILNKTKNNYHIKIIWSVQHKVYMWMVINAENGETKSLMSFSGVTFGRFHEANEIIKAKHLKQIVNKFGQGINNRY